MTKEEIKVIKGYIDEGMDRAAGVGYKWGLIVGIFAGIVITQLAYLAVELF